MHEQISRRRALTLVGGVGVSALLAACSTRAPVTRAEVPTADGGSATVQPQQATDATVSELFNAASSCDLTPETIEGPFYFDAEAIRSDLREGRPGTTLRLAIRVQNAECESIPDAVVDIWSCDAAGLYSGFESAGGGRDGRGRTDEETYLRGAQVTTADGIVEFTTLYPGWYPGRAVHIHAKVHLDAFTALTAQLYFDEAVNERVSTASPYNQRRSARTTNDGDTFFARESGERSTLTLRQQPDGWLGVITLGLASA